ncbi:hypothetical protein D0T53_03450 [Dysgonomonas sp. 216]|nr:hypothetical protein [Dysgonomonas sp. 216]
MFTQEVAASQGKTIPRGTNGQIDWFKENGTFVTTLSEVKVGDFIYWSRGVNKYHTGVIVETSPQIKVVHATVYKYKPGSIKENVVQSDGEIKYFNQPFVGAGRFK